MAFKLFEKSELKYILYSIIAIIVLMLLINVQAINKFISSWNPIFQFILINLGIYFFFFFFMKGIVLKDKGVWKLSLATVITILATDLLLPEYHVTASQGLIVGGVFGASASDFFFGYLYSNIFGISKGIGLVLLTYPFTFAILISLGAIFYRNFIKEFG